MKEKWKYAGAAVILILSALALLIYGNKNKPGEVKKTSMRIGVLLYRGDDTFISTVR